MSASASPTKSSVQDTGKPLQGYDAVFVPELDKKYACPVCLAALRDPVQTKCGHRFCKSCLEHSRRKGRVGRCPVDNITYDPKRHVFEDLATRREVLSLTVKCDNHEEGCTWTKELRDIQGHLEECQHESVDCTNDCSTQCKRKDLDDHLKQCPKRLENCHECGESIQASELAKHQLLVCQKFPVTCSVCGETGILRENMSRHVDCTEGDCPLVIIKCQFEHIGCYFQDKRKNLANHYKSANLHHMQLISMKIQQQESFLDRQQRQMVEVTEKCNQLTLNTGTLQRLLQEQGEVIQVQASCIHELESLYTFDGRLLWRLRVPHDAPNDFLTSPSFYTGRPGFKISLGLKTTDSTADEEDANVSLQLNVEEGQFDRLLQFPFEGTCQVTIFDQAGGRNNFKSSFQCHIDLQKPCVADQDSSATVTDSEKNPGAVSSQTQVVLMKKNQLFSWPYQKDEGLLILVHVNQMTTEEGEVVSYSSTL